MAKIPGRRPTGKIDEKLEAWKSKGDLPGQQYMDFLYEPDDPADEGQRTYLERLQAHGKRPPIKRR